MSLAFAACSQNPKRKGLSIRTVTLLRYSIWSNFLTCYQKLGQTCMRWTLYCSQNLRVSSGYLLSDRIRAEVIGQLSWQDPGVWVTWEWRACLHSTSDQCTTKHRCSLLLSLGHHWTALQETYRRLLQYHTDDAFWVSHQLQQKTNVVSSQCR